MMPIAKPTKQRTQEEFNKASYNMLCQLVSMTRRKQSTIRLSKVQAKRIFQALHTITLYLHQPITVRQGQVERILEVRDMLEAEYEQQLKESIETNPKKK